MKKLLFIMVTGTIVSLSVSAQTYKPFKVDVSTGFAIPGGTGAKGGVIFAIEPKYSAMDNIAVGIRFEGAVVARGYSGVTSSDVEVDVKASASYLLTGDYYLTNNHSFRPFAGAGAGIFSIAGASIEHNGETATATAGSKFGGLVRTGFEAGHFRLGVEYNLVPKTKLVSSNGDEKISSRNGYIGIKLGAVIGGGRKHS